MATEWATWPRATDEELRSWSVARGDDAGRAARSHADVSAENQALRERAEAAEAECARLKNIRSAIAEGYNAEAVALEKAVSETLTAQLTEARRAEAAAWNDACKQIADMLWLRGQASAAEAVDALRRAAPTEGEA